MIQPHFRTKETVHLSSARYKRLHDDKVGSEGTLDRLSGMERRGQLTPRVLQLVV